jgi:hypothetical protein
VTDDLRDRRGATDDLVGVLVEDLSRLAQAVQVGDGPAAEVARRSARSRLRSLRGASTGVPLRFALGCLTDALTFTSVDVMTAAGVELLRDRARRVVGGDVPVTAAAYADMRRAVLDAGFMVRPSVDWDDPTLGGPR